MSLIKKLFKVEAYAVYEELETHRENQIIEITPIDKTYKSSLKTNFSYFHRDLVRLS